MFRSAEEAFSEHRTECGTGDDIGPVLLPLGFDIAKIDELARRSVGQGCGHVYYKCPSRLDHRDVQKHKERTCTKGYVAEDGTKGPCLDSDGEPLKYRRCMYWEQDHNARIARIWGMSKHSDDVDDEANAGGTLHACGIHPTSDSVVIRHIPVTFRLVATLFGGGAFMRNAPKRITMGKSYVLFRVVRIPRRMMPLVRLRVCMRIVMNVLSINAPVGVIHGIRVVPILPIQILMVIVVRWQVMSVFLIRLYILLRPDPPPPTTVTCGQCSVSYNPQGSLAWSHEYIPCPRTRIAHDQVCGRVSIVAQIRTRVYGDGDIVRGTMIRLCRVYLYHILNRQVSFMGICLFFFLPRFVFPQKCSDWRRTHILKYCFVVLFC